MGRPKQFSRDEVLEKAISVFWEKGFSDTTLQDLEAVTGVNKSGLYSEFKNKEDMFFASLQHYLQTRGGDDILITQPLGWGNIQRFLKIGQTCYTGRRGCFSINSMRDVSMLPLEGRKLIADKTAQLRGLLIKNVRAESKTMNAADTADMILTFFSGLCIEENLQPPDAVITRRINKFLKLLQQSA